MSSRKNLFKLSVTVASGVAAMLFVSTVLSPYAARAATYTWDYSGTATTAGGVLDGSGNWSTSPNWWNPSLPGDQAWNNTTGDTAVFGTSAGSNPFTVTLAQATTAGGLIFQSQNYTIAGVTGNSLAMIGATSYVTPDFSIAPGVAANISASITKTTSAFTSGGGTLTLSGTDSFAPAFLVDNATLQVGTGASVLIKSGSLVLGANAVNGSFVQTGGSVGAATTYIGDATGNTSSFNMSGGTFANSSTFNLAYKTNSTMNMSGGSLYAGGILTTGAAAVDSATMNISGGTCTLAVATNEIGALNGASATINVSGAGILNVNNSLALGYGTGSTGVLNIQGGTANFTAGNFTMGRNNVPSSGIVSQSGGVCNIAAAVLCAWEQTTVANGYPYGAYLLSGGSLTYTGAELGIGWEGSVMGLFSQTGGTATITSNFYTGFDAFTGGTGVIDISGGRTTHKTAGSVMDTGGDNSTAGALGVFTVRNTGYFQDQTSNFNVVNNTGAAGIVNVVSGGTLETNRIFATKGTSTANFDGGTLRAFSNANASSFLTGLTNTFIYPGGLTLDTNGLSITISQAMSAPAGNGVGATGSTIAVASAGSGYLAPPVVTFSPPTSGVAATGVAVVSGGSIAGIIITSPGSGYTSGQPVTVAFNGNTNSSNLALTAAGSFSVPANTVNSSGGLTVVGGGTLTLTANNTYAGNSSVSNGLLYINGADSSSLITVAGGATLGGSGSTTAAITVNNGGILDFSRNTGAFSVGGSNLSFAGGATINVGALSNYINSPVLNMTAGGLLPSTTAGLVAINANLGNVTVISGTYDLINYTGSIGGVGSSGFTLSSVAGLSNRQNASLLNQSNQIDLVVSGITPFWNGSQSDWMSTNAFTLQPGNTPATFQAGDADVFDDTANGSPFGGNVTLNTGNVAPSSVTFNNSSLPYTLSGSFGITGSAVLALAGNGTVTITNSNGYTGNTTIGTNATLQLGAGGNSGSLSPSSAIVVNGTLAFSRSDNIVQGADFGSAGITGGGGLTQLGPGMVTLTASNTYSGPTTISGGTLQLGTGTPNQDGSISGAGGVNNNGTLIYNLAGSQTASYSIVGIGGLVNAGTGTLVLAATNGYQGGTILNAGTLQLNAGSSPYSGGGNSGTLYPGGGITVNSGATLRANTTDTMGYYAGSAGSVSLIGGVMTITAGIHTNMGYLGMTAGTLTSLGAGDGSGNYIFDAQVTTYASSAPSVINATTVELRGPGNGGAVGLVPFSVARGAGPVDLIVSSNLIGQNATSGLDMQGPGIMLFTGAGSFTGDTEIDSGTLQIGAGGATGSLSTGSPIFDYATLAFSRSDNIVQGTQFSGTISQGGGVTQLGPGMLTLNVANTYRGPTVIAGGVLNATNFANEGNPSAIGQGSGGPNASDLVIDSGTLQYTGAAAQNSNWIFTVGPTGAATVNASGGPGGTLTLGSQGGAIAFANGAAPATLTLTGSGAGVLGASIGDSGTAPNVTSLVKSGSGTWTLNGANSYSGTTTVNSGTLNIAGGNSGAGPINVNAGALYLNASVGATSISMAGATILGGTGSATSAAANIANGGTLDLSKNAGNTFSLGSLAFGGHATINVDALANYTSNPVLSTGALATSSTAGVIAIDANLGGAAVVSGTYDLINYTGSIGGAGLAGFTLTVNNIGSRQAASLVSVSNQIDVVVTGAVPYWNGNQPDWLSTGAWTLQPGGAFTTFQTGDTDIFDDSAMGSSHGGTVLLNAGNVAPAIAEFNNTNLAYTLSGAFGITGTGALSVAGSGLVTIANSNSYSGATTIGSFGTLQIGAGGASGALSPSSAIVDNGTLAFSRSDSIVQGTQFSSAAITGGGSLAQLGPGTVALTATNMYSGATTISGGTLQLGTGAAGQDGSIGLTSGVTDNGTLAFDLAGTQTASYAISGSGGVSTIGPGTLILAGTNGYTGSTTVTAGVLKVGSSTAFGASSSLLITAGTVDLAGNNPVAGALSGAPAR